MPEIYFVDFDGTLVSNSFDLYSEALGIKIENSRETTKRVLKLLKDRNILEVLKLKEKLNYRGELIKELYNEKNEGVLIYLLSDNPFVKYLIDKKFDGIYSTIVPEIKNGILTGGILKEYTKVEIAERILADIEDISKIKVYTDGGESDEDLIEYLQRNHGEKVEICRY